MDRMHVILIDLPKELQHVVLNRAVGLYVVWVKDIILFIDCITFELYHSPNDINFILKPRLRPCLFL